MKDRYARVSTSTENGNEIPWIDFNVSEPTSWVDHATAHQRNERLLMINDVVIKHVKLYSNDTHVMISFVENDIGWSVTMNNVYSDQMTLEGFIDEAKQLIASELTFNMLSDIVKTTTTHAHRAGRQKMQNDIKSILGIIE